MNVYDQLPDEILRGNPNWPCFHQSYEPPPQHSECKNIIRRLRPILKEIEQKLREGKFVREIKQKMREDPFYAMKKWKIANDRMGTEEFDYMQMYWLHSTTKEFLSTIFWDGVTKN